MKSPKDSKDKPDGVFFYEKDGKISDEQLHSDMLDSVAPAADEAGIRTLMNTGMTREEACRFISPLKEKDKK